MEPEKLLNPADDLHLKKPSEFDDDYEVIVNEDPAPIDDNFDFPDEPEAPPAITVNAQLNFTINDDDRYSPLQAISPIPLMSRDVTQTTIHSSDAQSDNNSVEGKQITVKVTERTITPIPDVPPETPQKPASPPPSNTVDRLPTPAPVPPAIPPQPSPDSPVGLAAAQPQPLFSSTGSTAAPVILSGQSSGSSASASSSSTGATVFSRRHIPSSSKNTQNAPGSKKKLKNKKN